MGRARSYKRYIDTVTNARRRQLDKRQRADAQRDEEGTKADKILIDAIKRAREDGVPWDIICDAIGVSRQAVHELMQKYA